MKTVINIKADKKVKEAAQKTAAELGVPLSTIINAYLKQFIRNKEVHLYVMPHVSGMLERRLINIEKDIKEGKNILGPFKTDAELQKYLHSL